MAKLMLFSVFVCFLSMVRSIPVSCPNLEDLKPCTCKRVAYGLQIICANFKSADTLRRAFSILRDYQVHTVLLHNLSFDETLDSQLFDGMKIKEIRIEKSRLRFDQPAFSGLDTSLYVLNVAQESMIKTNDSFSFAKLSKLNELYVQSNHIQQVKDNWLNDKVPNVHTVVLDYNDISVIQDEAFAHLPFLKVISLADNRIKEVKRSMFPRPAEHLARIDISFNDIKILPEDFFVGMPSLKEIVLSGNELKTLSEVTWTPVWEQLTTILLFENQLNCSQEMHWIKKWKQPYQLEGSCVSPKNMSGRSIKDIYITT